MHTSSFLMYITKISSILDFDDIDQFKTYVIDEETNKHKNLYSHIAQ